MRQASAAERAWFPRVGGDRPVLAVNPLENE